MVGSLAVGGNDVSTGAEPRRGTFGGGDGRVAIFSPADCLAEGEQEPPLWAASHYPRVAGTGQIGDGDPEPQEGSGQDQKGKCGGDWLAQSREHVTLDLGGGGVEITKDK